MIRWILDFEVRKHQNPQKGKLQEGDVLSREMAGKGIKNGEEIQVNPT
jgi:hypothetical protein